MPQYKEINLEFVSDNLQEIKLRHKGIKKLPTLGPRNSNQIQKSTESFKDQEFEVIKEDNSTPQAYNFEDNM